MGAKFWALTHVTQTVKHETHNNLNCLLPIMILFATKDNYNYLHRDFMHNHWRSKTIPVSDLAAGVYLLCDDKGGALKFIKQ
jgi:hypothetical protein